MSRGADFLATAIWASKSGHSGHRYWGLTNRTPGISLVIFKWRFSMARCFWAGVAIQSVVVIVIDAYFQQGFQLQVHLRRLKFVEWNYYLELAL